MTFSVKDTLCDIMWLLAVRQPGIIVLKHYSFILIVYRMGRLCGGAHEISGIKAPLFLHGWVVGGFWGWVGGGGVVAGWWVAGGGVGGFWWDGWVVGMVRWVELVVRVGGGGVSGKRWGW